MYYNLSSSCTCCIPWHSFVLGWWRRLENSLQKVGPQNEQYYYCWMMPWIPDNYWPQVHDFCRMDTPALTEAELNKQPHLDSNRQNDAMTVQRAFANQEMVWLSSVFYCFHHICFICLIFSNFLDLCLILLCGFLYRIHHFQVRRLNHIFQSWLQHLP